MTFETREPENIYMMTNHRTPARMRHTTRRIKCAGRREYDRMEKEYRRYYRYTTKNLIVD